MKIYVNYDCDDHKRISGVHTLKHYLDHGKTEEEIDAAVLEKNKKIGWEIFRSFELDDALEDVFRFMLGEKEYKHYSDITDIYSKLKDIKDDIESIRDDTFHMSEFLEDTIKDVEKLVPEEDKY